MEPTSVLVATLVIVVIIWLAAKYMEKPPPNLPPMPRALPIFGHLLFLNPKRPYETVMKWGKQLGPVFRLRFGSEDIYVLNNQEVVKEAFVTQGDNFSGRPFNWLMEVLNEGRGLILSQGNRWKEQRRFSLSLLRDFGFGRSMIADKIQVEIDIILQELEKLRAENPVVNVVREMHYCVANIITSIVFGVRFPRGDPEFERFQCVMGDSVRIIGLAGFLMYFPILRYIVPGGLGFWKLLRYKSEVHGFHRRQIAVHKAEMERTNGQSESDDFVTAYLNEMRRRQGSGEEHYFEEEQMLTSVADLFFAGQETTATTLKWGLLYLIKNPEVQTKMVAEMEQNVGRQPSLEHRNQLPFCHAVVMESQRLGNIVPFGVMHSNFEDAIIAGYRIPAGSTILPNLWACQMEERCFPSPTEFRPQRFLLSDGRMRSRVDGFMPFSVGKRQCLGESLARAELFMILTAIVWNYALDFDQSKPPPSTDPVLGFTVGPKPFNVKLTKRF